MKLEKFMWCMTLETIGLVFGFLGVFVCALYLVPLIFGFFYFLYIFVFFPFHMSQNLRQIEDDISVQLTIVTAAASFVFMVLSAFTYMYVLLIKGIQNKQHEKMEPWLVVHGIAIAINLLGMLSFMGGRVPFLFMALYTAGSAFFIYCYMAVHSLYENIKETSQPGLLTNEHTASISMPPAYSITEDIEQSQMDFDYMKLV